MPTCQVLSHLLLRTILVLVSVSSASAQSVGGSIQGVVSDATGAVLPGVSVTIKNAATGDTRAVITDQEGRYLVPVLPSGEYELTASLQGFQTVDRRGIALTVGQVAVVNVSLTVGARTELLTVTGEAPGIQDAGLLRPLLRSLPYRVFATAASWRHSYSVRNAIVGSMLSARRVGTTQPSMQTPSMTTP